MLQVPTDLFVLSGVSLTPAMLVLVFSSVMREQIKAADMIVVFEEGVLLEQGTHDSLVNDGGLYAQLAGHKSTRN